MSGPLRSSTRMPFANSSLPSWIIFEGKVIPFALNAFSKWKKFKEFTATVEWLPQLSFLTTVISIQKDCHITYVSGVWVPLLMTYQWKASFQVSHVPDTAHNIYSYSTWLGKEILSFGPGTTPVLFPFTAWLVVPLEGGTHVCST